MESYIALLRGINVSGQKKIKMADLRTLLGKLPFEEVQTYVQSGNIVFKAPEKNVSKVEKMIEKAIQDAYDFEVPILVKTPVELKHVLENNPFLNNPETATERLYMTFLKEEPVAERIEKLQEVDYSPEDYRLEGKDLYFFAPNGYGRAKMNNNFFEKKLKVVATTRNWRTVNKLYEMSQD